MSDGIPPASRNHLVPTADAAPTPTAASSLDTPRAIASQNRTRSSRRDVDGRPGDHIFPRITRIACWRWCLLVISNHLHLEVLPRPVDSAQYTSWAFGRRLRAAGVLGSMGSIGDAYDNAMAEAFFCS